MKSKNLSNTLCAFAYSFVSFLVERINSNDIDRIILFGSVARGDAIKESDIDIFIDTKDINIKKEISKITDLFYESTIYRDYWKLLDIKNDIKCIVGNLEKWKLKRSIISEGITLYGKTVGEIQGKLFCLFKTNIVGKAKEKLKIWRKLYGYKQKIGKKTYYSKGLIELNNGKKISPGVFILPIAKSKKITDFLKGQKIKYQLIEFCTDMF